MVPFSRINVMCHKRIILSAKKSTIAFSRITLNGQSVSAGPCSPGSIVDARAFHPPKISLTFCAGEAPSTYHRYGLRQCNASVSKKNGRLTSPTSYSMLRNKVTIPSEADSATEYVSPYSSFFADVAAGRTSLGTTEEMEEKISSIEERHLDCGIPESALRFITTSYGRYLLPPYVAPGEHRVIVRIPLSAIPFQNEQEKEVLLQIVGSRYKPEKDELQLSSEKFASRIENKRYLVGMLERIVASSRKLTKEFAEEDMKS